MCRACIPSCDNNSGGSRLLRFFSETIAKKAKEIRPNFVVVVRRLVTVYTHHTHTHSLLFLRTYIHTDILCTRTIHIWRNRFVPNKRTGWFKIGVRKADSFSGSLYIERRLLRPERILSSIFNALGPAKKRSHAKNVRSPLWRAVAFNRVKKYTPVIFAVSWTLGRRAVLLETSSG